MVDHWIAVLKEVVAESDEKTQFISCHGWGAMTKAQVAPQVAYMEKLWTAVRGAKASLTRAQVAPELAALADSGLEVPNIHEHNVEALWAAAR